MWKLFKATFLYIYFPTKLRISQILWSLTYKPPRDKTNNVAVRPAKTQINLWSESDQSSLCAQWVAKGPIYLHAERRLWLDWADDQVDLSLRWAHTHFDGFAMRRLISYCFTVIFQTVAACHSLLKLFVAKWCHKTLWLSKYELSPRLLLEHLAFS